MVKNKNLGLGSFSFFISLLSIILSCVDLPMGKLGDILFNSVIPYQFFTLFMSIFALILGYKYKDDLYANYGILLTKIFLFLYISFTILGFIQKYL